MILSSLLPFAPLFSRRVWTHVQAELGRIPKAEDWTFGDVPFHLAYFDAEIVCQPLEGRHPTADLVHEPLMGSVREMDAWNARRFRERPDGQTPEQSLARMRASRARIRALLDSSATQSSISGSGSR